MEVALWLLAIQGVIGAFDTPQLQAAHKGAPREQPAAPPGPVRGAAGSTGYTQPVYRTFAGRPR